jgi:hypothetical protein
VLVGGMNRTSKALNLTMLYLFDDLDVEVGDAVATTDGAVDDAG